VQVLVPEAVLEMEDQVLVDVPEIQGHIAHVQVEVYVVYELVHVLPRLCLIGARE